MKNWELWIQRNKPALAHPTNLKEQFVRRVLSTIDDIGPEHLAPAHLFTDNKGNERYVDILITIPDKQQIAIELDGLAPYKTADGDIDYRQFNEYLEQQHALNAAYPALLRYGASKIEHAPDMIASEIRETLRAQAEGSYLPKNKKEDNAAIVEAYQDDILNLKKTWQHQTDELKQQADRLATGAEVADAEQIRQLEAAIRAHEEKIRQSQRASIAAILTNEIDLKAHIADIQILKDIMDDIRQKTGNTTQSNNKKNLLLAGIAVIAIAVIASLAVSISRRSAKPAIPAAPVIGENSGVLSKMPAVLPPEAASSSPATTTDARTAPIADDLLPSENNDPSAATSSQTVPVLANPPRHEPSQAAGHNNSITARDTAQHIGETRRVCGKIAANKSQKKYIHLYLDAAAPKQSLTIIIAKNNQALVRQVNHLGKADICIPGKSEANKTAPQITVNDPDQISFNE